MKTYLLPAALALVLAACGGGGNDDPAPSGAVAVDAFTALVQSQYMDQSDMADVVMIDDVTVTTSETSDPIAI
jgi:hypothetical protein